MSKASFVRTWFVVTNIYACTSAGRYIGDMFFDGSRLPWLIGAVLSIAIAGYCSGTLKRIT